MSPTRYRKLRVSPARGVRYCLDVEGGSKANGAPILAYPCHKGANQLFHYNRKTKQLRNKHSRKCIEKRNGRLVQYGCNPRTRRQKWRLGRNSLLA